MIQHIIFQIIFVSALSFNFQIRNGKPECFILTNGQYDLQYIVSGIQQQSVRCTVKQQNSLIFQSINKSQQTAYFNITKQKGQLCFQALDNKPKIISVDFMKINDPLQGKIKSQNKYEVHKALYHSYQSFEKVYRDQHFFIERSYVHSIVLLQTQIVTIFFLILKIFVAFICSCFQLYFVKKIFEDFYKPLSSNDI